MIFRTPAYEIQKKDWFWGWLFESFADDLKDAERQIQHLLQEPKNYG